MIEKEVIKKVVKEEAVKHPAYYRMGKTEVIKIIEDQLTVEGYISFLIGIILQYVCRCLYKDDPVKDLQKCKVYIDYLIEHIERSRPKATA